MNTKISSLLVLLALAALPPAQAQYYGSSVTVLPADQNYQIRNNFNKRFAEIGAQISGAAAKGQLSQSDNANLSNLLNQQSAQMESNFASDGGFTSEESASMVLNLTNFANQATSTINAGGAGSRIVAQNYNGYNNRHGNHGYGNGYGNGGRHGRDANPAVTNAINTRISSMQSQISSLSQNHQIRRRQVSELSNSLDATISLRNQSMRNGINNNEAAQINASLDNISTQIQAAINLKASTSGRSNWDSQNWNDQRAQLRQSWKARHQLSAIQQQQLDASLKTQWLQFHNNSWQGQTTWDNYSDPQFLDYVHTKNPSLLMSIRNSLGI